MLLYPFSFRDTPAPDLNSVILEVYFYYRYKSKTMNINHTFKMRES